MDRIIVTLLLIIIGVTTILGLKTWISDQIDVVKNDANSSLIRLIDENN